MDEASGTETFLCSVLGPVMTRIEHGTLTKFHKLKPPVFHGIESEDAFDFILNCYERLRKLGIVHQHGVEFVTFRLQIVRRMSLWLSKRQHASSSI